MAAASGDRSSQAAPNAASAASMATSVSASRWRTAWNLAIGCPNWIRSRAWPRASSSMALAAPTSSWPTASWAQPHRPGPLARDQGAVGAGGYAVAGHLDETEVGIHPLHGPEHEVGGRHLEDPARPRRTWRPQRRWLGRAVTRSRDPGWTAHPHDVTRRAPLAQSRQHDGSWWARSSARGRSRGRHRRPNWWRSPCPGARRGTKWPSERPRRALRASPARRGRDRARPPEWVSHAWRMLRSKSSRSPSSITGPIRGRAIGGR